MLLPKVVLIVKHVHRETHVLNKAEQKAAKQYNILISLFPVLRASTSPNLTKL